MKTLTKVLLLSLACANFAHAGSSWGEKWETTKGFCSSTCQPQPPLPLYGDKALLLHMLVMASAFTKASTTALVRQENNSMVVVGKNTLKSLGGSLLASVLLWISNPDNFGLFGALNGTGIWNQNVMIRDRHGKLTRKAALASGALKVAAAIAYLAGQNNWDPRTGLTPKGIKELFTKKFTTTEQIEFVVNTFLPLIIAHCDKIYDPAGEYAQERRPYHDASAASQPFSL